VSFDAAALARDLRVAEQKAEPIALLSERFRDLTWENARSVARARDKLRLADGDDLIGWKLGWTSGAMRKALGIAQPNWGTLWASQIATAPVQLSTLLHPKIEPELVWEVPIGDAAGRWALGLEVVDPRFPSFTFDWLDNTADNSSAAKVAVGEFASLSGDVQDVAIMFSDGAEERRGQAADAMGSPANAVTWLIQALAAEDLRLTPGQIVFTGGLAAPFDVTADTTYELSSPDPALESVRFTAEG